MQSLPKAWCSRVQCRGIWQKLQMWEAIPNRSSVAVRSSLESILVDSVLGVGGSKR